MSVTFKDYFIAIGLYNLINTVVVILFFGPLTWGGFLGYNIALIVILLLGDKLNFKSVFWFLKSE